MTTMAMVLVDNQSPIEFHLHLLKI